MGIDTELQNLINEYVKQIESKEKDLTSFNQEIEKIIADAKKELKLMTTDLDVKFDASNFSEEEYLTLFRKDKAEILEKTKEKLNSLVKGLES